MQTHLETTGNLVQNLFLDILALAIGANVSFHIVSEQLLKIRLLFAKFVEVAAAEGLAV